MHRIMFLLSIIAALVGTPLRMAEAASDFARSLAEIGDVAGIESADGGVGDDSGATVKAEKSCESVAVKGSPAVLVPAFFAAGRQTVPISAGPRSHFPIGSLRRHALLQSFLC